ncbi:MAG: thiolase family protein, partial [Candidatus Paceibacterota bacterium]
LTEETNLKYNITREMQDTYAKMSYCKARDALSQKKYANEIVAINVRNNKSDNEVINVDEEINKVPDLAKLTSLKSAFSKTGSITPGNASKLNDGASAMILVSRKLIEELELQPVACIMGFDISVGDPAEFSRVPILSINRILSKLNITHDQVDLYEINEAFSSVPIMFHLESGVEYDKINIYGGAVALGHPIGSSGSRIVGTLISALHNEQKIIGCASICNGGGGAISMILRKC